MELLVELDVTLVDECPNRVLHDCPVECLGRLHFFDDIDRRMGLTVRQLLKHGVSGLREGLLRLLKVLLCLRDRHGAVLIGHGEQCTDDL